MKTCTICKEIKKLDDYYYNKGTLDKRGSQCKLCDTKERVRTSNDKKQKLVNAKGGKCSICGYNKCLNALDFHHLDRSKKEMEISVGLKFKMERLLKEIENCILVCANCHRALHNKKRSLPKKFGSEK